MMKYQLLKLCLVLGFLVSLGIKETLAQQGDNYARLSCSQKLSEAEDRFDEGLLSRVPIILNSGGASCFDRGGYSKEERIRAYKLLSLVYTFQDNGIDAEEAVINLLNADPEHPLSADDPVELTYLFSEYRSDPIFGIGLKAGVNSTSVKSIGAYGVFNPDSSRKEFLPSISFNAELTIEYDLKKSLEVILGFQYMFSAYSVEYGNINSNPESGGGDFLVSLKETQSSLKIPLMVRYQIPGKTFIPYVLVGVSWDYLLSAKMIGSRQGTAQRQLASLDLLSSENDLRKKFNYSIFAGVGTKYRINRSHFLFCEARYSSARLNMVKQKNRYVNESLLFDQAHVDDDKILNNVSLFIGYIYPIYKHARYSDNKLSKRKRNK